MKLCILVSALCILTSLGLGSDVDVDGILAPSGNVDSGQTIIPRMVITNLSGEPADSVSAFFTIEDGTPSGYRDSITGFNMSALTTETLAFGGWVPRGRDSATATAWIHCDGDTYPQNDTLSLRFFVRVKDIAVIQMIAPPPDTVYDSGVVIYPQCRLRNCGNIPFVVEVRFRIGSYQSSRSIPIIFPGQEIVVHAPAPFTAIPGIWACICNAVVVGDLHPENNIMVDTFTVTGTIYRDVGVTRLWQDSVDLIHGVFANLGDDAAAFWCFIALRDSANRTVFEDSNQVLLGPGDSSELAFFTITPSPGWCVACSVCMVGDQDSTNNVKYLWFPSAVAEDGGQPRASSHKPQATVMRRLPAGAVAFDAMGRRVVNPKSGIYFVADDGARNAVHVRKVVIQR